jgi:hypothetical protein
MTSGFDPASYYAFDLARGSVQTRHGDRVLVLSTDTVGPLVSLAVKHGDLTAVRALGKRIGEDAARSLGSDVRSASPEDVVNHASGTLAMLGFGALSLERWADALVLSLAGSPPLDSEHLGLAALLGGLLTSLGGRDIACVPIENGARFVVVHPVIAEEVWTWSKEGVALAEIVSRLAREAA